MGNIPTFRVLDIRNVYC